MKQVICFLLFFCLAGHLLQAQDLVQKKYITYNTKIQDASGHSHSGFIATIGDTAVFMSEKKFALTFENLDLSHLEKFGYGQISTISLRASGRVSRGALIGGISGLLVGALVGYSSDKENGPKTLSNGGLFAPTLTKTQATLIGAVIGAGIGTLVGIIIAHPHQVFKIHGKKANLDDMREAMIRKLY